MSYLAISSIVALLIKLSLFWVGKSALFRDNWPLALFLIALCVLNFAELMSFASIGNDQLIMSILQTYYAAAVIAAAALFYLSLHIIGASTRHAMASFAVAITIALLTFVPNVMLAGYESIGYSVTRIPGDFFFILQFYLVGTLILSAGLLLYGAIQSKSSLVNQRSLIMLISTLPLVFFTVILTLALSMGAKINGAVIISLMTSLMLVILIYTEKRYRLFKFLSYIPYTREHELRTRASRLVEQMIDDLFNGESAVKYKDIRSEFEATMIELAIESTGGNKTHAAKILGIGKATLHRKIEGLQI